MRVGLAIALSTLIPLAGCRHGSPSPPVAPAKAAASVSAGAASAVRRGSAERVKEMPQFRAAVKEYAAGRYAAAASRVEALERGGALDGAGRSFCEGQRLICLRKAANPKPACKPDGQPWIPPRKPSVSVFRAPARSPADVDCGPRALRIAAERMGVRAPVERLRTLADTTASGTTMEGLAEAAKAIGLKAEGVQVGRDALAELDSPALARVDRNHWVAVLSVRGEPVDGTARIHDPNRAEPQEIPQTELLARSGGYLLELRR